MMGSQSRVEVATGQLKAPQSKMEWEKRMQHGAAKNAGAAADGGGYDDDDDDGGGDDKDDASGLFSSPLGPDVFVPVQLCSDGEDNDALPAPHEQEELPALEPVPADCDVPVEQGAPSKQDLSKALCKFFLEGTCTKRGECPFEHPKFVVQEPTQAMSLSGPVCKYYLAGEGCRAAGKCSLIHVKACATGVPGCLKADGACRRGEGSQKKGSPRKGKR